MWNVCGMDNVSFGSGFESLLSLKSLILSLCNIQRLTNERNTTYEQNMIYETTLSDIKTKKCETGKCHGL
jgi:hypothetical protein